MHFLHLLESKMSLNHDELCCICKQHRAVVSGTARYPADVGRNLPMRTVTDILLCKDCFETFPDLVSYKDLTPMARS